MTRKCPNCGEAVPSYSVTCPKCFRNIPREEEKPPAEDIRGRSNIPDDRAPSVNTVNKTVVLLLAIIPAAFGLMGLAQIYEKEYKKGLLFLCVGLPLFIILVLLISQFGTGLTFLAVGMSILCGLVFVATFIIQAFDAIIRSIFTF